MTIVRGLENLAPLPQSTVVAVGTFDGIHTGHQLLLAHVSREARRRGALSAVVTFEPYPAEVLTPATAPGRLTTLDEKLEFVAKLEVDLCVVIEFTPEFARLPCDRFVGDILVGKLRVAHVVAGGTHTFGADRAGDPARLAELGERYGFTVESVAAATVEGNRVSSTAIREAIAAGDLPWAAAVLGRAYSVEGEAIRERGVGAKLGFPTANLRVDPRKVMPADGVYAVWADAAGARREAVASVGLRPTFPELGPSLEVHLLDFEGDLTGQKLRAHFVQRLRPQMQFPTPEALAEQMRRDVEGARGVLGGHHA